MRGVAEYEKVYEHFVLSKDSRLDIEEKSYKIINKTPYNSILDVGRRQLLVIWKGFQDFQVVEPSESALEKEIF